LSTGPYSPLHYNRFLKIGYVSHTRFRDFTPFRRVTTRTKALKDLEKLAILRSIPSEKLSTAQFYVANLSESKKTLQASVVGYQRPHLITGTRGSVHVEIRNKTDHDAEDHDAEDHDLNRDDYETRREDYDWHHGDDGEYTRVRSDTDYLFD
jgi:hypothetical protein